MGLRFFLLSLRSACSHISSPKNSFDSNQQQTSLFVRNKQDLMPWKSQSSGISASQFLFPIRQSEGQHSSGTTGYLAEESDACRDALETGSESQREWFKRLTLVSNSTGPVTGIFQDGFLYAAERVYWACECMCMVASLQRCCCSYIQAFNLATDAHVCTAIGNLTSHLAHQIIVFLNMWHINIYMTAVVKKKKYMTQSSLLHIPPGMRLSLKWAYRLKVPRAFAGR